MTATPGVPASSAMTDDHDPALLCEQARDLARQGRLSPAARLYEQVVAQGDGPHRARAAFGLAVIHRDLGEVERARDLCRTAMATGDPEFAPRAACHLALSYEEEGAHREAGEAWRQALEYDAGRYAPVAHHGLARLAEARGDEATAREHWGLALRGGAAPAVVEAALDYAGRLLSRGEVEQAEQVVLRGLEEGEHTGLRVLLGAVHVERAIAQFGAVAAAAADGSAVTPRPDPGTAGVAFELLARLLAVRGDTTGSAETWEQGLDHPDPAVAQEVRARLRRGFLHPVSEPGDGFTAETEADPGAQAGAWWDPYVETAAVQNSTPMLTGELFVAITRMRDLLAPPLATGAARPAELRRAMEEAVAVPDDYVWGPALRDDLRERASQGDRTG
ncbi:tetratricopeptide repeat protein [Marinactinospora thermotolerans]|uniref:Tetratricopeptide repeat-containing protein n=1 Tax=Marinactinospora thermotolerans DSM 45154 TaxID=1122192 RepID=A0A1T4KAM1_9ACTN|nr:tetratricopeptide repeat protein [Marinactinospora thermotolerans]SJZ39490.1 Tetratricopeptide repeat-containing protein [Marinactinospora thermotolerans DSM 45154]